MHTAAINKDRPSAKEPKVTVKIASIEKARKDRSNHSLNQSARKELHKIGW